MFFPFWTSLPTNFFDLPGKQLFGATYSNKDYTALDLNRRTILTSLLGFGTLQEDEGSWCGYYNFHQYLFTEEDDETQGVGIFGRYGIAEEEYGTSEMAGDIARANPNIRNYAPGVVLNLPEEPAPEEPTYIDYILKAAVPLNFLNLKLSSLKVLISSREAVNIESIVLFPTVNK